jgi:hypothetical protein
MQALQGYERTCALRQAELHDDDERGEQRRCNKLLHGVFWSHEKESMLKLLKRAKMKEAWDELFCCGGEIVALEGGKRGLI